MVVWTEKDDAGIAALEFLVAKKGNCLMVSAEGEYIMKFKVLDYFKANKFLMEIFDPFGSDSEICDRTGIKITEIGSAEFSNEKQQQLLAWLEEGRRILEEH